MKAPRCLAYSALFAVLGFGASSASSQGYPTKPVRLVVPYAAGGGADTAARTFAQKYTDLWKQQLLVENRGGVGGIIGSDAVAKSAPDGYTLLFTTNGLAISSALYRKLPFDAVKDFAPVTQLSGALQVVVSGPKVPAASMKELIALAKAQPGKLNYGSTGLGGVSHLAGEMLRLRAGIDIVHVPYKGDAQSIPALLAGDIQLSFVPLTTALQHIKAGRLRALAVTTLKRSPPIPGVPTMVEAGVRDYEFTGWLALFAPAGTSHDILTKISADAVRILRMPDVTERLLGWGLDPAGTTPQEFSARYKADIAMYAKLIKDAGVPLAD